MTKKVVYDFTSDDIELLKEDIPASPCTVCSIGIGCCGCPQHREWKEKYYTPLSNAGLLDVSADIEQIKGDIAEIGSIVDDLKNSILKVNKEYPGLLRRFEFYTSLGNVETELDAIKGLVASEIESVKAESNSTEEFAKKLHDIRNRRSDKSVES